MPSAKSARLDVAPLAGAVQRINAKTPLGTALRSAEIAKLPLAIRERSQISATVTSARIVNQIQSALEKSIGQMLDRVRVQKPGGGHKTESLVMSKDRFVAKLLDVTKDELGTAPRKSGVQDLRSVGRAKLIYDIQTQHAYGKAHWATFADDDNLNAVPAQEFVRIEDRKEPRKDWPQRWRAAGGKLYGGRMIALKTDPVWANLSRFNTPWPPYDYGSGMGVQDIFRSEAVALGLLKPGVTLKATQQDDFNAALEASTDDLSPTMRGKIKAALGGKVAIDADGTVRWIGVGKRMEGDA